LSLLDPNILLNILFSNTLSLRSSHNVSDQVSHPYETTGKIIVLYMKYTHLKLQSNNRIFPWQLFAVLKINLSVRVFFNVHLERHRSVLNNRTKMLKNMI
jgi:hypothetical protein